MEPTTISHESILVKQIADALRELKNNQSSVDQLNDSEHSDGFTDQTFKVLNDRHNIIYEFVMRYNDYIYAEHDYGDGIQLTMIESHTLTYIGDHPGTTITELAEYWKKTKGALSQTVSRLENLSYVEKRKENGNAKNLHLYLTPSGQRTSHAHKLYDILDITKTLSKIHKKCTSEEIDSFYKVLGIYYEVISADFEETSMPKHPAYSHRKQSRK